MINTICIHIPGFTTIFPTCPVFRLSCTRLKVRASGLLSWATTKPLAALKSVPSFEIVPYPIHPLCFLRFLVYRKESVQQKQTTVSMVLLVEKGWCE